MDDFDQTLKKLGQQVSKFTNSKTTSYSSSLSGMSSKINMKKMAVYGAAFILIPILLSLWKPRFVMQEVEDNEGDYVLKINFRKLLIGTLVAGSAIDGLIFLYLRKKEINI